MAFHGGGFHGGGFHDFHHHGFRPGFVVGLGFYPYDYGDYYAYDEPYYADEGGYNGCYLVRRRIHTSHGWRLRSLQVCE
jgi:hypothetical protein